jgi:multiple sugar transport system ATP-binding protein
MVRHPAAFLLDEPLSNLDAKLRVQMRSELTELQRRLGATMIYVTHDQAEAMTMSDRVAVMLAGRLQQVAPPKKLYDDPESLAVAEFVGSPKINVMKVDGGFHAVRPEAIELVEVHAVGAIAGHVRLVEHMGSESLVHVDAPGHATPIIARLDALDPRDPKRGEAVGLRPLPDRILKFDAQGVRIRG